MVALECGGSDGYSGITANPALGYASDILVEYGGTAVLAETPEIYGAEHLLVRRAASQEVGQKLIERIRWWEDYTTPQQGRDEQQPLARQQGRRAHHHPRKIARRGGQGRHLAARRRGALRRQGHLQGPRLHGHARLRPGRHDRADRRRLPARLLHHRARLGLRLEARADDQARHQLAASIPPWKRTWTSIAATSSTATRPSNRRARRSFRKILAVASGERSKSELLGLGDNEFVPWQIGATM